MDSNIKDICYNPRLHDLVLAIWPPCCGTSFVVVVDRAQKRLDMRSMCHALTAIKSGHSIFKMADDESKTNTSLEKPQSH